MTLEEEFKEPVIKWSKVRQLTAKVIRFLTGLEFVDRETRKLVKG